jgi:RimJ/RimL family protein N-acetyltransferase
MKLIPLDTPELIERAATWMADVRNYQWLDLGFGSKTVDAVTLKFMAHRATHCIRAYTGDDGKPIGLVGLSQIDQRFGTAWLWGLLGEKKQAGKGLTTEACRRMLHVGFNHLGLAAIQTWAVECNPFGVWTDTCRTIAHGQETTAISAASAV